MNFSQKKKRWAEGRGGHLKLDKELGGDLIGGIDDGMDSGGKRLEL